MRGSGNKVAPWANKPGLITFKVKPSRLRQILDPEGKEDHISHHYSSSIRAHDCEQVPIDQTEMRGDASGSLLLYFATSLVELMLISVLAHCLIGILGRYFGLLACKCP